MRGGRELHEQLQRRQLQLMLRRALLVGALVCGGIGESACIYDFDIPGDTGDDDPAHKCAPNQHCTIDCPGGHCGPVCEANSTCTVNCSGGNCDSYCAPNATCTFNCSGGNCDVDCAANATCTVKCTGGNCDCNGAGCHVSKE